MIEKKHISMEQKERRVIMIIISKLWNKRMLPIFCKYFFSQLVGNHGTVKQILKNKFLKASIYGKKDVVGMSAFGFLPFFCK